MNNSKSRVRSRARHGTYAKRTKIHRFFDNNNLFRATRFYFAAVRLNADKIISYTTQEREIEVSDGSNSEPIKLFDRKIRRMSSSKYFIQNIWLYMILLYLYIIYDTPDIFLIASYLDKIYTHPSQIRISPREEPLWFEIIVCESKKTSDETRWRSVSFNPSSWLHLTKCQ